jgi:hypothetical protein
VDSFTASWPFRAFASGTRAGRGSHRTLSFFVSAEDEVLVSGKRPRHQQILFAVGMIAFALVILLGVMLLIRTK